MHQKLVGLGLNENKKKQESVIEK